MTNIAVILAGGIGFRNATNWGLNYYIAYMF